MPIRSSESFRDVMDVEGSGVVMCIDDVREWTRQIAPAWGMPHAERVIRLTSMIDAGLSYDRTIVTMAGYLHDWGAYPKYFDAAINHEVRSRQIIEADVLPKLSLSASSARTLLETIEYHDYRDQRATPSTESLVLREADFLDFLGVIGICRDFSWIHNNMQQSLERIVWKRDLIKDRFTIPAAKAIATQRLADMERMLKMLDEQSFGIL